MGLVAARWRVPGWVDPDQEQAELRAARVLPPGIYCADSERTAWLVLLRREESARQTVRVWRVGVGMHDFTREIEIERGELKRVRVLPEAVRPELWRRAAQAAGEVRAGIESTEEV